MAYAPIQNPTYIDATEWPYIKGPNYTRPVFKEHSREGNFRVQPIIRMPALNGLGLNPLCTPGSTDPQCSEMAPTVPSIQIQNEKLPVKLMLILGLGTLLVAGGIGGAIYLARHSEE